MRNRRVALGIVIAAVAVAALIVYMRWVGIAERPADRVRFATWDAYLASPERAQAPRRQVVFIGIDGAAWTIIDPMIAEGLLPTFERLKNEGSWGDLRSVDAYVSPPAWATMMTGYTPDHTGIYTFGQWSREEQRFLSLSSKDVRVPAVWDVATLADKRVATINVPVTYPARPTNGIMISGLMTPVELEGRRAARVRFKEVREPEGTTLRAVYKDRANRYRFELRHGDNDDTDAYNTVDVTIDPIGSSGEPHSYSFRAGEYSQWLRIDHARDQKRETGFCRMAVSPAGPANEYFLIFSRTLFSAADTHVPFAYPDSIIQLATDALGYYFPSQFLDRDLVVDATRDAARFASFFYGLEGWDLFAYVFTQTDNIQHLTGVTPITTMVYQVIDRFLADLLARLPAEATLVIASDHGFREYTYAIDLNKWLAELNLLTYTADGKVDYSRTLAFHNMWCIYFNDSLLGEAELAERGIKVESGKTSREALMEFIESAGHNVWDAERNAAIPLEFTRLETADDDDAPDMIVTGTYGDYAIDFWNLRSPRPTFVSRLPDDQKWNHTIEGIYLVHGPGVKRGFSGPPSRIEDVTPTMLYLLDVPEAANVDGRVMEAVFEPDFLHHNRVFVVDEYDRMPETTIVSDEEREALEKKLRNLGYIR